MFGEKVEAKKAAEETMAPRIHTFRVPNLQQTNCT
jgi:hypothetical protein